jgi:hypothetical protein
MSTDRERRQIAREAKAIVALAFRNGPIEQIHAGRSCPTCIGRAGFSRITDDEMKSIMKNAVNRLYELLVLKEEDPVEYESKIQFGERYTARWDEPQMPRKHSAKPADSQSGL